MKLERVQILRLAGAAAVLAFHAAGMLANDRPEPGTPWPLGYGYLGVDLFFVISGFIIHLTTRARERDWRLFLTRRIARVVPLYWLCTLAIAALTVLLQRGLPDAGHLLRSLLFLVWTEGPGRTPLVYLGWSLEYEMFFYFLAAAALAVSARPWRLILPLLALLVGSSALPGSAAILPMAHFFTNPLLLEFTFGVLIGEALLRRRVPWIEALPVAVAMIAILPTAGGIAPVGCGRACRRAGPGRHRPRRTRAATLTRDAVRRTVRRCFLFDLSVASVHDLAAGAERRQAGGDPLRGGRAPDRLRRPRRRLAVLPRGGSAAAKLGEAPAQTRSRPSPCPSAVSLTEMLVLHRSDRQSAVDGRRLAGTERLMGENVFDEIRGSDGPHSSRPEFIALAEWIDQTPRGELERRQTAAEAAFRQLGITFAVYGEEEAAERIIPFDIVPRIFTPNEWSSLSEGLVQRVEAINAFLDDVYSERHILAEGLIPEELILGNPQFQPILAGVRPPHGIYAHICGIDLVRTGPDQFFVLEDNARTPSGVSYMLENREAMLRLCPELFQLYDIAPVDSYPDALHETLRSVSPRGRGAEPVCVLLTPGHFNSAFYEHSFLADSMGIELVEAADLEVDDDIVWMRTIEGRVRVDVIYRRIDDDYIDPLVFKADSLLGVPGIIAAYMAGNVALVNAPGTGIADDKAIYSYMPEIVRFYSGGEAKLPNVETYRCREPEALRYTLDNLEKLVVKLVDGSGGYGMLVGPTASRQQIEEFRAALIAEPARYIAQPTLALSTVPTLTETGVAPRHVDFRPFVLSGTNGVTVVPGGLTRVALREGSLVVNSSQGGGTKDSMILQRRGQSQSQSQSQTGGGSQRQSQSQSQADGSRPLPPLPPLPPLRWGDN